MKHIISLAISFLFPMLLMSQTSYSLRHFSVDEYKAGCQNRDITVSSDGILYVANNKGLLIFDGNGWRVYDLMSFPPMHKIATTSNNTIYTQAGDYKIAWTKNESGTFVHNVINEFPANVKFETNHLTTYPHELPKAIRDATPTVCKQYGLKYLIGTERAGLFVLDEKGKLLYNINTENHLADNHVRGIYVQNSSYVWLALDNGISQISFNSPIMQIAKRRDLGKLERAGIHEGVIFFKTTTGAYTFTQSSNALKEVQAEQIEPHLKEADRGNHINLSDVLTNHTSLNTFAEAQEIYRVHDALYWFAKENEMGLFSMERVWATLKCRILFDNLGLDLVTRGQKIFPLTDNQYLLSAMQGIYLLDINTLLSMNHKSENTLFIRDAQYVIEDGLTQSAPLDKKQIELPHDFYNLELDVATSVHSPFHHFSYYIEGVSSEWTEWTESGKITILKLPEGKYNLKIRKYATLDSFPEITLGITIKPAWYNTIFAYLGYVCLLGTLIAFVLKSSLKTLHEEEDRKTQRSQQEEAQRLEQTKNKLLEEALAAKKHELTFQTTMMLKRSQSTQMLIEELDRQKVELGDRYPKKMYNRMQKLMLQTIDNREDQILFESSFDSAHHDFRNKLQATFPDLTPGDLRICCLLRMNLSTKEIASLMNISIRGVELRRHRIRKRMNIPQEVNLIEMLITF